MHDTSLTNLVKVEVQSRMFYNPELKSVFNFVPGVMTVILMLVSAMMTSISITREKEIGTINFNLKPTKKILIVSYYWPPAGGPGVQRWLKFVKYFNFVKYS